MFLINKLLPVSVYLMTQQAFIVMTSNVKGGRTIRGWGKMRKT